MENYIQIVSEEDMELFLKRTNHLHDGYVISTTYKNDGIEMTDEGYDFFYDKSRLTIQVLVTSLEDTIVEIIFDNVYEWQISGGSLPILDSYMYFDAADSIVFTDEEETEFEHLGSIRVVAGKMSWRVIEF